MNRNIRQALIVEVFERLEEEIVGLESIETRCVFRDGEWMGLTITIDTEDIISRLTIRKHSVQLQIVRIESEENVLDRDTPYKTIEEITREVDLWVVKMKETISKMRN